MRRLSTVFKKERDRFKDKDRNSVSTPANGYSNGYANGDSSGTASPATVPIPAEKRDSVPSQPAKRHSSFGIGKKKEEPETNGVDDDSDRPANRQDAENIFTKYAQLIHAAQRPLPNQTGDGTYIETKEPSGLWNDLKHLGFNDVGTLKEVLASKASGKRINDKTYLMERVIQLVAALPSGSQKRVELTNAFIDELWNCLQHPPLSYLGDKYKYRQADGSYNNIMYPQLGAANTPYARSVAPMTIQPGALPDPGLIFDSLFARDKYTPHPNGVSSILYYWASIIIHDLFQTDHQDFSMSKTSSYLDLSPLYGDVQADQDQIRTFKDGMLKPDCFSEERLMVFPPGVGVILIMFNRFHNYVAEQLPVINEGGRFTKPRDGLPAELSAKAWKQYDEDIFQTARLITSGLYMNITLGDYLRTIVGMNHTTSDWALDPRVDMAKVFGNDGSVRGTGNQVSAEFNLVYRWHSCISQRDEEWTEGLYKELFGKPGNEVSMHELLMGLHKWETDLPADPFKREWNHMKRDPTTGKYDDDQLVSIINASIEDLAGSSGARNVPKVLKAVEILGMQQARKWNLATLNEFRKFFGLEPHKTFESINKDPDVAAHLKHLYEHPDFVEMYPGMVAEEAKVPMDPGVGIAPTFTISRAILSDAVCLVRGDRFYTVDYTPKNLTNWGYSEVQYDMAINQGCVMYKLFLRSFPRHYKANSCYVHYPMTTPETTKKIMTKLGRVKQFDYSKPVKIPLRVNFTSYGAAKYILEHQKEFNVCWQDGLTFLMGKEGGNFMLSGDTPFHAKQRELMGKCLYHDKWHQQVKDFYEYIVIKLLHQKSCKIAGRNQVDLVRDVNQLAHIHFASNIFSLPLKTEDHPKGIFSEHEMYMIMALIFIVIFFDLDPVKTFPLRQATYAVTQALGKLVEANVKAVMGTKFMSGIIDKLHDHHTPMTEYGVHMIRRLAESGMNAHQIAWSQVLPTAGAMVANQSVVFTQCIDYYLSEKGKVHLPEIKRLAYLDTPEADEKILHYFMEGVRLNGTFGSYREATVETTVDDGKRGPINVKPGDKVFVSFVEAAMDPKYFPEPDQVKLDRPMDVYLHYGVGPHSCLGGKASQTGMTAMLKTIAKLENLRRAPGPQGELKKIPRPGGFYIYMREDHGSYFPFPTTMKIHWDGPLPPIPKLDKT